MTERGSEYINSPTKRRLDVFGASVLGVAGAIPAGIGMLGSALETGSSPLFMQTRIGKDGEPFDVIKIKTLHDKRVENDPNRDFGTDDPRADLFGKILRTAAIDELPQVLNILNGDMTLVGPRPVRESSLELWQATDGKLFDEWQEVYEASKPGLVGAGSLARKALWRNHQQAIVEGMRQDIDYAETASLEKDLKILAATPLVLGRLSLRVIKNRPYNFTSRKGVSESND